MKKLLVLFFVLCPMIATAQDKIVKKDGSTVLCRVEKVSDTEVTFKKWEDLKGPSYIMDKSLVSAINYEDGRKDPFGEVTSPYTPNNQIDGVRTLNDRALLKLDAETDKAYKKVKQLKTWGWIGGGVLAATGIALVAAGIAGSDGFLVEHSQAGLGAGGAVCFALGVGVTTTCLVIAHKQKKKIDAALQTSSLYRYDIPFGNGSQLSVGADMLHDRIMNNRTVGLGMSYNF